MNKKLVCSILCAAGAASAFAEIPEVSDVVMSQNSSREVTITYKLTHAPAVVTLDIETNNAAGGWVSIGGENINTFSADSEVWKKVSGADGATHTIKWRPDLSWPDHKIPDGGARAVVTAWALDNPPDYMVVDITRPGNDDAVRYYPAEEFLPGGLLGKDEYRTTSIVMRKVMAKGVTWTMGSVSEAGRNATAETAHSVTLDDNYYIGVFPVTQSQWALVQTNNPAPAKFKYEGAKAKRPVENVCYNEIRNSNNSQTANTAYDWPADPNPMSFLGMLRNRICKAIDFDLPTEAQWEYACRAGNGEGTWGNGKPYTPSKKYNDQDTDPNLPGRYRMNGGYVDDGKTAPTEATCTDENGTAAVGSYDSNSWGVYDMHGNVLEWCLDWYEDNISGNNGAVNIQSSSPQTTLSGASGVNRVLRGGCWYDIAKNNRSAFRFKTTPNNRFNGDGLRLCCPAIVK